MGDTIQEALEDRVDALIRAAVDKCEEQCRIARAERDAAIARAVEEERTFAPGAASSEDVNGSQR